MKFFIDLSKKQLIKSAASNVALERLVLKRRDSLAVEVVFVSRNAVATMPAGTTVSVALKKSFSDSNFLASASGTPPILNLNTVPLEALFSATNPSAITALLEIRWTVPGETTRTATLTAEVQNSVILGTEATPEAIPDGKATQAQAEAGTNNDKWMTPLRTAQAIAVLAPPPTWDAVQNKPATFPPSAHTHAISEVTGLQTSLDSKASSTALTAEATLRAAADTALGQRIDFLAANLDPAALDSIAEAAASIGTLASSISAESQARISGDTALDTKITAETTARTTALATKANSSDLSGTAYKLITKSETITANWPYIGDSLGSGEGRAIDWKINFTAPRTVDFLFNINPSGITGVIPPVLGDYVNVTLSGSATPWTANFKRPDGTLLLAVTSADPDLKKTNLRFVYDGTSWVIDRTVWTPSLQSALDSKQPTGNYVTRTDVQSGGNSYFERSADAASQNVGQGQSVHQLVLANDTRLSDPRRVQWFPAPANNYTIPNGATAGAMAYDGSFLYVIVSYTPANLPVGYPPLLRWARTPLSMTW